MNTHVVTVINVERKDKVSRIFNSTFSLMECHPYRALVAALALASNFPDAP